MTVLRAAERHTGLVRWGSDDFRPRLELWLRSIKADRGLNDSGRRQIMARIFSHACNRLRLEKLIHDHPEIERIDLPPPVVVTGLPRSGTTALASFIGKEMGLRSLPHWEALEPFSGTEARRRMVARRYRAATAAAVPGLPDLHDCREDAFVDDTELQCLAFGSYALEWHAHVPGWRDAYLAEDQTPVYRYLKRAMQALTFLRGPSHWIIKSPQHMEQLRPVARVFPGASLIVIRRDLEQSLASMDRMMAALSVFRSSPFPPTYWRDRFRGMVARYDADKGLFPERIEIELEQWARDPSCALPGLKCLAA